jgi:indolepyruvate ferredoxin oxidoreductase alpha subunit
LRAIGVKTRVANPLDLDGAIGAVTEAAAESGVRAIVFESPCVNLAGAKNAASEIDGDKCTGCGLCVSELGCPALKKAGGKADIDAALCTGCGLCAHICAFDAIGG